MWPLNKFAKGLLVGLMVVSVGSGIATRVKTSNLDSANFLSFIEKSTLFSPLESDFAATNDGLKDLIRAKPEKVCDVIDQANYTPRHFFRQKPFIAATLISASGWVAPVPTSWLAGLWIASSLVGGLLVLYTFMRKSKLSITTTLLVLATVSLYPVFSNAFLGQIYMDLLMFGPATALVLSIWWMKNHSTSIWRWTVLLTILLGLISERGAYLAGLVGFGYTLLLFGKHVLHKKEVLCVSLSGLTMGLWGFIWSKFIMINRDFDGRTLNDSLVRLTSLLEDPLRPLFITFVSTSLVFICLALFSGRTALIALGAITPTLLVSTGGAELTGFYTHYHQTYLPVLVSAAVIGFVRMSSLVKFPNQIVCQRVRAALGAVVLLVSLFNWTHYGQKSSMSTLTSDTKYALLPPRLNDYARVTTLSGELDQLTAFLNTLQPKIISGGESIMPALLLAGFKDVEYWPVGVGVADVVVAPLTGGTPNVYPFGDIWGNGQELQECTVNSLINQYQLVQLFENYGVYQKNIE
jgi:hypothetical protein